MSNDADQRLSDEVNDMSRDELWEYAKEHGLVEVDYLQEVVFEYLWNARANEDDREDKERDE